ncbi:MAG: CBS domain-containing protein [Paracoccaceae bacterium]
MLVKNILDQKPFSGVLTIKSSDSLMDAAKILSEKRIGALIVSDSEGSVDGILSERDIVREIGRVGPKCMADTVGSIMTDTVIACRPNDNIMSVMAKMSDGRFRHMPVLDGGQLIGVVSIGDVVKRRIDEIESENSALTGMISGQS